MSLFSDFHLFLDNNVPSKWTTLLVKFLQIYCLKNKLNDKIMQKLCFLMKYFNKMKCSDFDILDNCFVSLLEKYPEHLLLIENGSNKILNI